MSSIIIHIIKQYQDFFSAIPHTLALKKMSELAVEHDTVHLLLDSTISIIKKGLVKQIILRPEC